MYHKLIIVWSKRIRLAGDDKNMLMQYTISQLDAHKIVLW